MFVLTVHVLGTFLLVTTPYKAYIVRTYSYDRLSAHVFCPAFLISRESKACIRQHPI